MKKWETIEAALRYVQAINCARPGTDEKAAKIHLLPPESRLIPVEVRGYWSNMDVIAPQYSVGVYYTAKNGREHKLMFRTHDDQDDRCVVRASSEDKLCEMIEIITSAISAEKARAYDSAISDETRAKSNALMAATR